MPLAPIKQPLTSVTHNSFRQCRVRGQPFLKQLYTYQQNKHCTLQLGEKQPHSYLPSSAMIKWLLSSSIKQANTSKPLALNNATSALRRGTSTFTAWQAAKFVLIGTRFDKLWRFPKVLESILPRDVYLERYCVFGFCLIKNPCKLSYNTTLHTVNNFNYVLLTFPYQDIGLNKYWHGS